MIRISHSKISDIAKAYSDEMTSVCTGRAAFCIKILDVITGVSNAATLEQDAMHSSTKKSLADAFLRQNKIGRNGALAQVIGANAHLWIAPNRLAISSIFNYLTNPVYVEELLLCRPEYAIALEERILLMCHVTAAVYETISPLVKAVVNYGKFDDFAYGIAGELGISTCPYCNRTPIHTVVNHRSRNIIRATFDHFFSQKRHSLLSLSFYNLIPSCYYCNSSLKKDMEMSLSYHLHPYLEGFGRDISFSFVVVDQLSDKSHPGNYEVVLRSNVPEWSAKFKKVFWETEAGPNEKRGNANLFRLQDIYQSHRDTIGELVVRCDAYSSGHAASLFSMFHLPNTNKVDFYRYYFGNYYEDHNFHRRPLAKLSRDIVGQLLPHF